MVSEAKSENKIKNQITMELESKNREKRQITMKLGTKCEKEPYTHS